MCGAIRTCDPVLLSCDDRQLLHVHVVGDPDLVRQPDPGLSPGAIGLAFGIGSLGGVLGAVVAPAIARRIGLGVSAMVGSVLFPLPIAMIAFVDGPTWVEIAVVAGAEFVVCVRGDALRHQPDVDRDRRDRRRHPQPGRGRLHHGQLRHPPARCGRRWSARLVDRPASDPADRCHGRLPVACCRCCSPRSRRSANSTDSSRLRFAPSPRAGGSSCGTSA